MKKRITALLLCCVMLLTLCPGLISTATAYDDTQPDQAEATGETVQPTVNFTNVAPFLPPVSGGVRMQRAASFAAANFAANDAANFAATDNGMKISKTAKANGDGSYTITLEAYATGSKVITEQKTDIPTDIILVLDQSGSMAETMSTYGFREYTGKSNSDFYALRHNGARNPNLYYKLDDGSYATVSVTVQEGGLTYTKITNGRNNQSGFNGQYTNYWENKDNLYALVNGKYQKVTLTTESEWFTTYYVYKLPDSTIIARSEEWYGTPIFEGIDGDVLYLASADTNKRIYTYTYTDADGNLQTIGTSTGADTQPTDFTLYERYRTGSKSRLNALKDAVTNFTNAVAKKAAGKDGDITTTGDNINHRIAVVGFASSGETYNEDAYENTEVFVGATEYTYGESAKSQYRNALQSMDTAAGKNNITSSIGALDAYGGTFTDLGMEMANGIFENNPIPDGQNRNRVIIVFTDGYPGTGDTVNSTVATNAVSRGYTAKQSTADGGYGATVYTVGIFSGADGTPVESFNGVSNPNKFMHLLSSNYKNAQSYSDSSKYGTATYPAGGGSYYLSAADADSLNSIFEQISDQIETGGSSSTLTAASVVKDIISPQFTLPAGTQTDDITLETYKYKGPSFAADNAWEKNPNAMGATAKVNGDTVSVTGFDFAANYVGTVTENGNVSYRGNKLVISFKVQPKAGFLGGNDVTTNASAGIYENSSAQTPVRTFDQPEVNVPIKDVTVTAKDKNVYLLGGLTAAQLKEGAMVKVGDVTLNLAPDATNYGLEAWQTAYVNITVEVKDKDGNVITTDLTDLTDDTTYTVEVTVAPKTQGTSTPEKGDAATAKTGVNNPAANVYVFKPELTFNDGEVYYGDTAPTDYSGNLTKTEWKHGETLDTAVTMAGTAPTLTLTYTPDNTMIADGKINTKQDVPVSATVKIDGEDVTSYTTFLHEGCNPACGWNEPTLDGDPAFLLHVNTCTLTITKTGCDTVKDANQSFIFNVTGNQGNNVAIDPITVTVQENGSATIVGLPVGRYTVTEDGHWSWRYEVVEDGNGSATLSAKNPTAEVTITNQRTATKWLSGDNYAVNHVGGIKMPQGTFAGSN